MIIVREVDDKKRQFNFYMVDSHHHIGEDIDNHKNLSVNGSFDFFRSIWNLLRKKYRELENSNQIEYFFEPKFKIIDICPPKPLEFLNSNQLHLNSWIFDQFIAFPFHDKFRAAPREDGKIVNYHKSNLRLKRIVQSINSGCRLIGYCRLTPLDEQLAIDELDNAIINQGLKGIKLHPISDGWNERKYFEDFIWTYKILMKAIKYNIPIIFDCRFTSTLRWIYNLVEKIRTELLENGYSDYFIYNRLKVIIAHIGFLWQQDDILFKALSHPCIYGDLTGLFSSKTRDLIINLKEKVKSPFKSISEKEKKYYWSTKIFLGSDFNYFEAFHIVDQLLYFLSKDFYNLIEGNLLVLRNIFSNNIIRLLPNFFSDINIKNRALNKKKEYKLNFIFNKNDFFEFLNNFIVGINNGNALYPSYFHYETNINQFSKKEYFITKNSLNHEQGEINFYFEWLEKPIILAGIIPHNIEDRYIIYLFNKNELNHLSFEKLKTLKIQDFINNNENVDLEDLIKLLENPKDSLKEDAK
ncbi:MAG: amidohydrolase family protein [Promethearchaeota archaeon]